MPRKEIPDSAIEAVAKQINARSTKNHGISVVGNASNIETPQIFEILPFAEIDKTENRFYAIDGSYNSEEFYNGLAIAMYTAGYVCFHHGKQLRMNGLNDPVVLGQAYYPENLLVTNQDQLEAIYDEMLTLKPIKRLLEFWSRKTEDVFPYDKTAICTNLSTLLSFCQNVLEIALILEIAELPETKPGDIILRDGTLRSLHIKQHALIALGKYVHGKGVHVIAITKQSPMKMELSYTFKQIDNYLQDDLKKKYPFVETDPKRKKLCCWFEVPDSALQAAYQGGIFAKKGITGGRGFGLFFAARLDYVEKLQNYDWVIVDVNIFDAIPGIESNAIARDRKVLDLMFKELTRLTQEHYILGYPYPLAEAHSFISLKRDFKQEIVNRLKYSLYKDQRMDHVDIENLFLDTHDRF
jgi:NurA domain